MSSSTINHFQSCSSNSFEELSQKDIARPTLDKSLELFEQKIVPDSDEKHLGIIENNLDWLQSISNDSTFILEHFFAAIENDHLNTVKLFVESIFEKNIQMQNESNETVLMIAAKNGCNLEMIKYLAQQQIDIKAKDKDGNDALIKAAEKGHRTAVKFLLNYYEFISYEKLPYTCDKTSHAYTYKPGDIPKKALENHLLANTILNRICKRTRELIKNSKNALLFFSRSDWNNAFTFEEKLKYVKNLSKFYNVKIIFDGINSKLAKKMYDLLFIGAHGNVDRIEIADNHLLTLDNLDSLHFSKLSEKARIVLFSCFTAKDESSIAYEIAKKTSRLVIAPKDIVTEADCFYDKNDEFVPRLISKNQNYADVAQYIRFDQKKGVFLKEIPAHRTARCVLKY